MLSLASKKIMRHPCMTNFLAKIEGDTELHEVEGFTLVYSVSDVIDRFKDKKVAIKVKATRPLHGKQHVVVEKRFVLSHFWSTMEESFNFVGFKHAVLATVGPHLRKIKQDQGILQERKRICSNEITEI